MSISVPDVPECSKGEVILVTPLKSKPITVINPCKRWCFTLNNYSESDEAELIQKCCAISAKYVVGREVGESGTPHLQGYIEFKSAVAFGAVKTLLGDNSVHLEGRRGTRKEARDYCMKPESRYADPIEFGTWTGESDQGARVDLNDARLRIQAKRSWNEVLNDPELCNVLARHPRWVREVYDAREIDVPAPDITLRTWQTQVLDMLDEEPVKRRVIWIWSDESGTGKTTFFDFCSARFNVLPATDFTNTLYAYDGQRIIWFDLTRAQSTDYSPYHAIEKFSNCTFHLSTKYTSTRKYVNAHVVVTANIPPDHIRLPNRCIEIKAIIS